MKKNNILKTAISLAIVSLFALFAAVSGAPAGAFAVGNEWTTNDERTELYCGDTTYYAHEIPADYRVTFWDTIILQSGSYKDTSVRTYTEDQSILFVDNAYDVYFTTNEKYDDLKNYFNGSKGLYFLSNKFYDLGASFDKAKDVITNYKTAQKTMLDVTTLFRAFMTRLIFTDTTRTFLTAVGDFYLTDDKLYYVHYEDLPNNAFDSEGNLSYRSGEVPAYELTEDECFAHDEAYGNFDNFKSYTDDGGYGYDDPRSITLSPRIFWTFILGITLPLMVFLWSLVVFIRKRHEAYKRLIVPVIASAVWLVAGIIVFVLLV